jgi:uncharacterized membrane protein
MRGISWGLVAVAAVGVSGYAVVTYAFRPLGIGVHPDMRTAFEAHPIAIYTHIFGSLLALLIGPFQFLEIWRGQHWDRHRILGRLYLASVAVGGVSGFLASTFAFGGIVGRLGFALLAVLWLTTGSLGLRSARRGDIAAHRRWMVRNYALTFSAVTFRLWLGGLVLCRAPFEVAYPVATWACWALNLVAAEWLVVPRHHKTKPPSTTSVAPVM